jgi:hypothetical protein
VKNGDAHRQSIRFPPSVASAIRERARQADRSFSAEVVHTLRRDLSASGAVDQDAVERLADIYRRIHEGGDL